jgi:hypothetical protein
VGSRQFAADSFHQRHRAPDRLFFLLDIEFFRLEQGADLAPVIGTVM